jgi:hypothetical protein
VELENDGRTRTELDRLGNGDALVRLIGIIDGKNLDGIRWSEMASSAVAILKTIEVWGRGVLGSEA